MGAITKIIEGYYHLGQALGENNLGAEMIPTMAQGFIDGVPIENGRPDRSIDGAVGAVQDVVGTTVQVAGDTVQNFTSWIFGK